MNAELEQKIFEEYPDLFQNRHKSNQESCMAWGIEFGDGWYDLIKNVCFEITQHEKNVTNEKDAYRYKKDYEPVRFDQIKQKFGGLRIYYSGGDEHTRGVIDMAEAMSYCICEDCGNKGTPNKGGWITTLCENCRSKPPALSKG